MSIHSKLGLKKKKSAATKKGHRTHVEDSKDPVEVRLPVGNRILVVPRVNKSSESMPPALLDDLVLYFRDSPAIENTVGGRTRMCIACSTHVLN